uniref:Uncharacterized protein n=1 Tax=Oryza rufipogon TaxID=4529 RepID=A0A0E0PU33_ORYRU
MGRIHRLVQCGGGRERRAHRAVAAFAVGLGSSSALMFSAAAAGDRTGKHTTPIEHISSAYHLRFDELAPWTLVSGCSQKQAAAASSRSPLLDASGVASMTSSALWAPRPTWGGEVHVRAHLSAKGGGGGENPFKIAAALALRAPEP